MSLLDPGITRVVVGEVVIGHVEVFTNTQDIARLCFQIADGRRFQEIQNRDPQRAVRRIKELMKLKTRPLVIGLVPVPGSARPFDDGWSNPFPVNPKA